MFSKTIKFKDFNEVEHEKVFYFHLNRAELIEMAAGGDTLQSRIERMIAVKDVSGIMAEYSKIVQLGIGVKSEDGMRFVKTPEIVAELMQSPAYDKLLTELMLDPEAAAAFVNQLFPRKEIESMAEGFEKAAQHPDLPKHSMSSAAAQDRANRAFDNPPNPVSTHVGEAVTAAPELENEAPAWYREKREPTMKELREMSTADMALAMKARQAGLFNK